MRRQRASHEDLTDPGKERILGTLTPEAWGKLSVLEARSRWYQQDLDELPDLHPMDDLIHTARQSSGSIRGEHRKDLVDALKGSTLTPVAFSAGNGRDDAKDPGDGRKERRRGL